MKFHESIDLYERGEKLTKVVTLTDKEKAVREDGCLGKCDKNVKNSSSKAKSEREKAVSELSA